jgi:hypothetical protein
VIRVAVVVNELESLGFLTRDDDEDGLWLVKADSFCTPLTVRQGRFGVQLRRSHRSPRRVTA